MAFDHRFDSGTGSKPGSNACSGKPFAARMSETAACLGLPQTLSYSHSIINEPAKPLICISFAATAPILTVTFTVKARGSPGLLSRP